MLVQQAIFTSIRGNLNAGYQLAARSLGITDRDAQALAQWGPSHDSLYGHRPTGCVNFHSLDSGLFSISKTILAGREYSGRGGERVLTHSFLVDAQGLAKFANNPFRIMQALVAGGKTWVPDEDSLNETPSNATSEQLEEVQLVGRASIVNDANLQHVSRSIGADRLATLVCAALRAPTLGVVTDISPEQLFACLLDLLPPSHRTHFSFTTGLRVSLQRPFRLTVLPDDQTEQYRAGRQICQTILDLRTTPPPEFSPDHGWPMLIHRLLSSKQYHQLQVILEQLDESPDANLDQLAESLESESSFCS